MNLKNLFDSRCIPEHYQNIHFVSASQMADLYLLHTDLYWFLISTGMGLLRLIHFKASNLYGFNLGSVFLKGSIDSSHKAYMSHIPW